LRSITIGNGIQTISNQVFDYCYAIESVYISDVAAWCKIEFNSYGGSNPLNNSDLYLNGEKVTDLIIPADVTSISDRAFESCNSITSVTIPENVQSMGGFVFAYCKNLVSATFENGVTFVGNSIFAYCEKLKSVELSNTITTIGESAFSGCSSLDKIEIPNSVITINNGAFSSCKALTKIVIPQKIKTIGNNAFYYCEGLKTITIRECDNLWSIGEGAFEKCKNLEDFYCFSNYVLPANGNAFRDSYIEYATLHVKSNLVTECNSASPWKDFGKIVAINGDDSETPKCAIPTIAYEDGELKMSCNTEGVKFVTDITDTDIKKHYDTSIKLSATYTINVYATKPGYDNSNIITATLCWIDVEPQTEGIIDEDAVAEVKAMPVLIQTQGGIISIQGAAESTLISIYDTNGKQYGSTISEKDRTTISTSLQPGTPAIVKIGEKAVKVLVK
jgi:hypothetical protein